MKKSDGQIVNAARRFFCGRLVTKQPPLFQDVGLRQWLNTSVGFGGGTKKKGIPFNYSDDFLRLALEWSVD